MAVRLALLSLCFLQALFYVRAEGKYSVIGPGTIHSENPYNVAVAVFNTNVPCQLKIGITGLSYNQTQTIELNNNEIKTIEFEVPPLDDGVYNLTAEGLTGIVFQNTTRLNMERYSPHIKIQTDKGTYKPGDLINYRVIFLDKDLKPAKPNKNELMIWFEDGKQNIIKIIKDLDIIKGVYTGKFQISEHPVMGNWKIQVKLGTSQSQAYIKVENYVLPKYKVSVTATENVAVKDGDMQVIVRANYTYGKPVNGKVTLLLDMNQCREYDSKLPEAPTIIKTTDMVNGKAKFDINVREYETYFARRRYSCYVPIAATVEENFTEVKINGSSSSTLHPNRYSMYCLDYAKCSVFHAGQDAEVPVQILYIDGTPINDTKSVLKLTYTETIQRLYNWRGMDDGTTTTEQPLPEIENAKISFEGHMNASGIVIFKVNLPELAEFEGFRHYYSMNVTYADENHDILLAYQYREPKNINTTEPVYEEPKEYFKSSVQYEQNKYDLVLGKEFKIMINSSDPLSYFVYNIIGRGNIVRSERVELPDKPNVYNLTVTPTFDMSAHCCIYIYYVDDRGEFHYTETTFYIKVQLQNKIEITSPEQVKPGEEVDLHIKTSPNSFVGLLAVDQSVLLLNENNDLHQYEFNWKLGSYTTSTPWQGGFSRYPGDYSGVVTLTNANYDYNWTKPDILPNTVEYDNVKTKTNLIGGFGGVSTPGPPNTGNPLHHEMDTADIKVRNDFSETWIFDNIENSEQEFTWSKKIPDTITSWVITGFSLSPEKGIGITADSIKTTVFQPFFVAIRLPYSVKRGEIINIPALVFNYLTKDLDVDVTLNNIDGEFEFTEVSNEVINEPKLTRTVRVPANAAAGVSFMIRPKIIGNIMLKFMAISPLAGDAVHKTLKVVPEGITEYVNRAYLVNLKETPEFKTDFELELPADVVPDSEYSEFAVVGDLLGPLLNNLDTLVRLPTGCGEQTMSSMVPNYLVARYLKVQKKLSPLLEAQIKRNLEIGYQRLLTYRHSDDSFSSFGPSKDGEHPRNGSTWLTAYVVRSLHEAKDYVDVDQKILAQGLSYLASKQAANGSFIENGEFFYDSQARMVSLTASVLLTFLEYEHGLKDYEKIIDNGVKYILENLEKEDDLRVKALATFALHKAKHNLAAEHIAKLKELAKNEDGRQWWSATHEYTGSWWRWSYTNDVETTSYVLLSLLDLETETIDTILPIIKWLVAQRNSYGGFTSTQDTVVGLKALIKFIERFEYEPAAMDISFTAQGSKAKADTIAVNADNGLQYQSVELPEKTRTIQFEAKGKGAALVQISYQYNVAEKDKKPSFSITTQIDETTPTHKLEMHVHVQYSGDSNHTNMAVLEVSLPSGYTVDIEQFEEIEKVHHVRQVETKNFESMIIIYFDRLPKDELIDVPISAYRSFAVAKQKPASIVLYDYYDTTKRATAYYLVSSQLCDICEDDEKCKDACQSS